MKKSLGLSLVLVSMMSAYDMPSFKTDGYIRFGYQNHKIDGDKSYKQDSIGGKLSISSVDFKANGIGGKFSFYTTNRLNNHDNEGVNFFDKNSESYSILGEAYLFGRYQNTTLSLGRQELDTPFADTDDVGMIPNTFEAAVLANTDLPDTTLLLAGVRRWSGVDTDTPSSFQKMQNDDPVKMAGVIYEGIKGLGLSAYYYDIDDKTAGDIDSISYLEAIYSGKYNSVSYELGLQNANQKFKGESSAKVVGYSLGVNFDKIGLGFNYAYNKSKDHSATNGFGGGPFFTSSEHLTLADAGSDGKASIISVNWDASLVGLNNLTLGAGYLTLKDKNNKKSTESDFTASYELGDNLSLDVIYSKIKNDNSFNNTRVFVNYTF